jgi:excisionase family DNA binding protein
MPAEFRRLLTVREVADLVGLPRSTIYALLVSGELPGVRVPGTQSWRVDPEDLRAFLDRGRTKPASTLNN